MRVGIDRGTGGALAPIFADGSFAYAPIPETEPAPDAPTFASLKTPSGQSLAAFLPRRMMARAAHIDPDFEAFTYGDAASNKRRQLLRLEKGDLLVFYAGLEPWPKTDIPRLFAIGWLEVKQTHRLTAKAIAADPALRRRFGRTAHFLRDPPDPELALVEGETERGGLLEHARPLGDGADRLLPDLAALGYRGSLRRAVGHWLKDCGSSALEKWLRLGPASLVADAARCFAIAPRRLDAAPAGCRGRLVIDDPRPAIGDWVFANENGVFALARLNARAAAGKALASLFWHIRPPPAAAPDLPANGAAGIRALVADIASRYRIGVHSGAG